MNEKMPTYTGTSNIDSPESKKISNASLDKIESGLIEEMKPIEKGETRIILQRHEKFDRDRESVVAGHLTEEGVDDGHVDSARRVENLIEQTPESERDELYFLVLSSDSVFIKGARSLETAEIVTEELSKSLEKYNVNPDNILNNSHKYSGSKKGEPRITPNLREPGIFEEPLDFLKFMKDKYPDMKDFWVAYETDVEKDKRKELGAEGPEEMADRINKFMGVLNRYSSAFHKSNPNSRLVIWNTSHYDTISPWFKKYVMHESATGKYLPVEYGAGVSISINNEKGEAKTLFNGKEVDLKI